MAVTKKIPLSDYIIYCATSTKLDFSKNQTTAFKNKNLKSLKNFLKLIKQKEFKNTKTIFTSSGIVYGKNIKIKKLNENLNIKNSIKDYNFKQLIYYKTKIESENLIKKFKLKINYKKNINQPLDKNKIDFYIPNIDKIKKMLKIKKINNLDTSINQTYNKLRNMSNK